MSGHLDVSHADGTRLRVGPGDAYVIEPEHDSWVPGDEPFVSYEFENATVRLFWKNR